jgi:hypothetical protein
MHVRRSWVRSAIMKSVRCCLPEVENPRHQKTSVLQTPPSGVGISRLQDACFFLPGVFNLR